MAKYTLWMGYAAVCGLVVGLFSIWLIFGTLRATQEMALDQRRIGDAQVREAQNATRAAQESVAVTQRIGEAQVSAYLSITGAKAVCDTDGTLDAEVVVKNYGQSPARDVHFVVEFMCGVDVAGQGGSPSIEFVYSTACLIGDVSAGATEKGGPILMGRAKAPENVRRIEGGMPDVLAANIGVFAADVFDREIYKTMAVWVTDTQGLLRGGVPLGQATIPLEFQPGLRDDTILRTKGWTLNAFQKRKPKRQD